MSDHHDVRRREHEPAEGTAAALTAWSQDVRDALRRLEPGQRRVVQLIYFERRTEQQAAIELGMPPRAVARVLAAAMRALALAMLTPTGDGVG